MKLKNLFARFHKDEDGAVTVDFVVLTAAVIALTIAVMSQIGGAINSEGTATAGNITGAGAEITTKSGYTSTGGDSGGDSGS